MDELIQKYVCPPSFVKVFSRGCSQKSLQPLASENHFTAQIAEGIRAFQSATYVRALLIAPPFGTRHGGLPRNRRPGTSLPTSSLRQA